jgi:hypothetical protein
MRMPAAAALVLALVAAPVALASAPAGDPPRDPDELPMMAPPGGQPKPQTLRKSAPTSPMVTPRRIQLTLMPVFASLRHVDFIGRRDGPTAPIRGGGIGAAFDVKVARILTLRVDGSHTVHPVDDEFRRDSEDEIQQTAARGSVRVTNVGAGVGFAMDLGRVLPQIDAGAGLLWMTSPDAVQDGQRGGSCTDAGSCDPGLVCGADSICHVATIPTLHAGIVVDILLRERWVLGAGVRYFAVLAAPTVYPVYLQAALRLGLRF